MNLREIVERRDWLALAEYVQERYGLSISQDHAANLLYYTGLAYCPEHHGLGSLDVRLKTALGRMGYLAPMFSEKEDEEKVTWNELHLFAPAVRQKEDDECDTD